MLLIVSTVGRYVHFQLFYHNQLCYNGRTMSYSFLYIINIASNTIHKQF